MKRKVVLFAIFLAILLSLLTLWAVCLYETTYSGRDILWSEPEYAALRQALANEKVKVIEHEVSYAGPLAIVRFEATVPFGGIEIPYATASSFYSWGVVIFFGVLFVSLGSIAIFQPGGSSNEETA